MKKILLNTLFKKEISEFHKTEKELIWKIKNIEKNAEKQIEEVKRNSAIAERIFNLFDDAEIIGIEENKFEKVYVFKKQKGSSLDIFLCSQTYQAINGLPRILTTINYKKRDGIDQKNIKIDDIQTVDIDLGNGSILMKYLIKLAKAQKVSSITGWLSSVDQNHFDRSEHYYEKFEFDVKFNNDRSEGSIKLDIL